MSVRNIVLTREYGYKTIYYDHWWNIPISPPKRLWMWREVELEEEYLNWKWRRDKLIDAVRNDLVIGNGFCSSIDWYTDYELWEVIKYAKSEAEAVSLAREEEGRL